MPKGVYDREAAKRRRDAEGEERAPSRDDGHRTVGSPVEVKVAAHAHKFEDGSCIVEGCRVTAAMVSTPGERNVPEESAAPKPKSGVGRICPECGNIETDGRRRQCMRCHSELPKKEKPRPVGETDRPFKVDDDDPEPQPPERPEPMRAPADLDTPTPRTEGELTGAAEEPSRVRDALVALAAKTVRDGIRHGFELELDPGLVVEFDAPNETVRVYPSRGNDG